MRVSRSAYSSSTRNPSLHCSERGLLFRDYIERCLYDPVQGYFSRSTPPVLKHVKRPRFHEINSRAEYQSTVANTYSTGRHGWMTPIELFSPFLSKAIANRLSSFVAQNEPINIIEIGAGRGTLAADILAHWSRTAPDVLRNVQYNIVEISSALADMQSKNLQQLVDSGHVKVFTSDARTWFNSLSEDPQRHQKFKDSYCHIIGTEVLDNVPHDLVRVFNGELQQAVVVGSGQLNGIQGGNESNSVEWTSSIDHMTAQTLQAFKILDNTARGHALAGASSWLGGLRNSFEELLGGGKREVWVPSGSYQLLDAIVGTMPHASLTISDFDFLPGALPGENGPVVQRVERGTAVVYDSVEAAPFGEVDIMFPTNFNALQECHHMLCRRQGNQVSHVYRITSQQQFFLENAAEADIVNTTCKDGYNPVLQDFGNASFLLVDNIPHNKEK